MNFSSKALSQTVVQLCLAKGIDHIVLSPGSRNAPLTIGFTEHPNSHNFSIVDERSAAFFALGMAQQLKKPVAVVCTSGSALLNYFPAVAEAFYSDIPLVVLSADRPPELLEIGDGQTIQQENVYGKHILYSANCKEGDEHQTENEIKINAALNTAFEMQGPVHINVPFSEPLYEKVSEASVVPQNVPPRTPNFKIPEDWSPFLRKWNSSPKKFVLVGTLQPNALEKKWLDLLANDPSVLVLTETTSNLHHENFIPAIDQLISSLDYGGKKRLQPEILLTFGGMVVSKRIKKLLRTFSPKEHWHVDRKKAYDTYFSLTQHFKITIQEFCKVFLSKTTEVESDYQTYWLQQKAARLRQHGTFLQNMPFSDFSVFEKILEAIPNRWQVQLANSATVRYAQLFNMKPDWEIYCNRGTSGIDGSTSTAVGAAFASPKPTVLLTGDLSFLYDSNALWNANIPKTFRVIVINNSGGGIFRILPKAKSAQHFERYFETQHSLTAEHLAKMYGFHYTTASDKKSLVEALHDFFSIESESPAILEVFTPNTVNDDVLQQYFNHLD
ncbi:2-succinyl-5-enolpyruvyl-6-hydroxy-3-cyclohexene-1-carboxylic-acid synthase [Flavobacteriaceae bacterium TK19130]|nr:2-succinyl-5-enolpyruvyl-6-hydroxy-3-cyclohexene-1-carboxylic-acid synthase [Thermobacterium salinum]